MRYNTHLLTSLGRLVFYHYDFDNYPFFSLFPISNQIYFCVTERTQQSLTSRMLLAIKRDLVFLDSSTLCCEKKKKICVFVSMQ